MSGLKELQNTFKTLANAEKAIGQARYFQAFPGGYAEGDCFHGITVPQQRNLAKSFYKELSPKEACQLVISDFHEERLTGLLIWVLQFEKAKDEATKEQIVELYLSNTNHINNWDLVDTSAPKILGPYFYQKDRGIIYELAHSNLIWEQRIAVLTTFYFIKNQDFEDTLLLAKLLLQHKHDLMHKALGWMLREIGNRSFEVLLSFLKEYYREMPRTMLRYAIEKFPEDVRQDFLKGKID